MVPHIRIPSHITALYVFAVVNLTLLVNITLVEANISVLNSLNSTIEEFEDLTAKFGNPFPEDGLWGRLVPLSTKDEEACRKIHGPPKTNMTGVKWIALIKRNHCDFDVKVLNAQKAGYSAAIIHNVNSDSLIAMGSGEKGHLVHIPSVFIGATDGLMLKNDFNNFTEYSIVIDRKKEFDANLYLLPFAIVVGICFILMLFFMVAKWLHDLRRKRRSRISKEHLKKIPVKKFKKGDDYEMCAICLDEYEDGDKLRILPCAHAYHMKCVDPWLTKSKRLCPLCKKKVIPGDVDDSSSDSDSEDESDRQSETAPLLAASSSPASSGRRRGDSFERSGLPRALRGNIQQGGDTLSDTSSDDGSITASFYQSSVEVHEPRHGHGSIQSYGATASVTMANETDDDVPRVHDGYINLDVAAEEDDVAADPPFLLANLEGLEGAVGGVDSVGLHIVEDHYHMDIPEPQEEEEGDLSFGDKEPLTASTGSSGSNSSRDEHEVSVRNGTEKSRKGNKSKRRPQNGMV